MSSVITNWLTPWSTVLPEKLTGTQLLKKFPAFYGTRRFITVFTRASHLSLSWVRATKSMPPYPTSRRSILILSSNLRLGPPCCLLPLGFPTKNLYSYLLSSIRAKCLTHLMSYLVTTDNTVSGVHIMKLLLVQSSSFPCYLVPRIFLASPTSIINLSHHVTTVVPNCS